MFKSLLSNNDNVIIIEYLKELTDINTFISNKLFNDCLMIACKHGANISVIKYLIEVVKINTAHCNKNKDNCLIMACEYDTNLGFMLLSVTSLLRGAFFQQSAVPSALSKISVPNHAERAALQRVGDNAIVCTS